MRVLGIDPGTRCVGYGFVRVEPSGSEAVDFGVLRVETRLPFPEKLKRIHSAVSELLEQHRPDAVAVEEVFVSQNAKTTLRLGHARGVILLAAVEGGFDVAEYAPRAVKQAVLGNGSASKEQVIWMVSRMLRLPEESLEEDAADALAVALCHGLRCKTDALLQKDRR